MSLPDSRGNHHVDNWTCILLFRTLVTSARATHFFLPPDEIRQNPRASRTIFFDCFSLLKKKPQKQRDARCPFNVFVRKFTRCVVKTKQKEKTGNYQYAFLAHVTQCQITRTHRPCQTDDSALNEYIYYSTSGSRVILGHLSCSLHAEYTLSFTKN